MKYLDEFIESIFNLKENVGNLKILSTKTNLIFNYLYLLFRSFIGKLKSTIS